MDSAHLPIVSAAKPAPAMSNPADALATYAREWPELASALVGGRDVADGATYRALLQEHLDQFLREQSTGSELSRMVAAMRAIMEHSSGDQFKLALAADARTATEERLAAGHLHTFWGVTPIINLLPLSAAARRLGVVAETFCYRPYHVTGGFDVSLAKHWDEIIKGDYTAYTWLAFVWAMLRYDVFHTFYDAGILQPTGGYGSPNFGLNLEEMQLLRAGGKRLYCFAYGADNRTRKKTLASGPVNFCMHCPSPGRFCVCSDDDAARMFDTIDQYTTANIASGLSTDYVPNCYEMHYLVTDTDAIEATPIQIDDAEPLRILHAPNHPHFKGSHYLMDAVDELRREGVAIELELISGASQTDVMAAMRRVHVVADQFVAGYYGQTAIEAMALGRPVLCYIRDPERAAAPDELPIINCHPHRLKEALRTLVADRRQLPEIGEQSRLYAERHHSLQMFAHRLRALYMETADLPSTIELAAAPSTALDDHQLKLLNEKFGAATNAARNRMREGMAALVAKTGRAARTGAAAAHREATRARQAETAARAAEAEAKILALEQARAEAQAALAQTLDEAEGKLRSAAVAEQAALGTREEANRLLQAALQAEEGIRLVEQAKADQATHEAQQRLKALEGRAARAVLEAEQAARTAISTAADQIERMQTELRTGLEKAKAEAEHATRMSHSQAMHGVLSAEQAKRDAEEWAAEQVLQAREESGKAVSEAANVVASIMTGTIVPGSAVEARVVELQAQQEIRNQLDVLVAAKAAADLDIAALAAAKSMALNAQAAAQAELAALAASKSVAQAEAAEAANRARVVAETLRQIQTSKAWRITAPLRYLHHVLRGMRKHPKPTAVRSEAEPQTIKVLAEFKAIKGRRLRVLHIGNPDNQAYLNAKAQRRAGIEADVLCIGNYGATASPEWEEVNFKGDIGSFAQPDWWSINLNGFKRPSWFAQGPIDASIRYLLATKDRLRSAKRRLRSLNFERWVLTRRSIMRSLAVQFIRWRTGHTVGDHGMPANAILMQYWGATLVKWSRIVPVFGRRIRAVGERGATAGRMAQGLIGAPKSPEEEANSYVETIRGWRHPYLPDLLNKYDVVQTYGSASVIPYLGGHTDFLVYENDALRSTQFASTIEGATGVDSHRIARRVLASDADIAGSAQRLGVAVEKVLALPHAIDSERLVAFAKYNRRSRPKGAARFLAPGRHEWVSREPEASTANDRIVRALAIVCASGRSCTVQMLNWGADAENTRQLARDLGVADMIAWRQPMPKLKLWKEYLRSEAVLDQFTTSKMSQPALEAMFLASRVISRADAALAHTLYGEPPPLYTCESPEDIAKAMMRVIDDPVDGAGDGFANASWARRVYGSSRIVGQQVAAYQEIFGIGGLPTATLKGKTRLLTFGKRPAPQDRGKPRTLYRRLRGVASRSLTAFVVKYADAVLARAMKAGAKASVRRQRSGRMRSLWGVTPILTLPLLARCDALLGLRSRSLVYVTYHIAKNFDINLTKMREYFQRDYAVHVAFLKWVLAYAVLRYDVFHFFYDRGITLPPNGRIQIAEQELEILKSTGKRIYTYAYGADVRTRETTLALGKYNFCADCDSPRRYCICSEEEARQNVEVVRQYANEMVSMIDMIHYVPGCRNMHYWPMDVDKVAYVGTKWDGSRPLRLLHAPNHMHFKGSRHLLAAVEKLQAEGVPIELKTISGVPNAEVLRNMAETDIVAEQFIGGAYGYTAVEAWAMGKPVLTYVRDDTVPVDAKDFPGINTNPDTLYDVLKGLASGSHDLQRVGRQSRRYVERFYSLEGVALGLGRMYRETGNLNERMRTRIATRLKRIEVMRDARLARPLSDEIVSPVDARRHTQNSRPRRAKRA